MENPLLDSNIIDKNNRDYVLLAKVSQNDETLRILIDQMQLKLKFASENKTYLNCSACELLYVLQNHDNLQMSIFYKKQQQKQKENSSNKCQQCQQFLNGVCFKKCYKCNSKQIICFQNEEQRLNCQICFSELCKSCDSNLEIFQQFPDKCTQKNVTNCQRYFYVITMIISIIPLFANIHSPKFQEIQILMLIAGISLVYTHEIQTSHHIILLLSIPYRILGQSLYDINKFCS
ncbi:unnamed protein product (macronuclear) [Paramecium tetraurelia]|uniref:Transmembrane protein n=1 Tax=Paramecium tetraurelia TaxID=5888 RepID=A0BSI6_PARTE|nr:uncharacterized protein GSPATT00031735001 [Paramecium tetraurelia]CAK61503.1 unnamed protein product [Paramecium tetraurelia]|eukprot:XP_001428901.1 hypothetical protein (macronuclear) [Paramecium tetraurelia strain d4-2]